MIDRGQLFRRWILPAAAIAIALAPVAVEATRTTPIDPVVAASSPVLDYDYRYDDLVQRDQLTENIFRLYDHPAYFAAEILQIGTVNGSQITVDGDHQCVELPVICIFAGDGDRFAEERSDFSRNLASYLNSAVPRFDAFLFQGLWTDPVTGLSYARNRWYDARTASWLSEDPKGAVDSPNLYAFVGWGPHMGTDPMGLAVVQAKDGSYVISSEENNTPITLYSQEQILADFEGFERDLIGGGLSEQEARNIAARETAKMSKELLRTPGESVALAHHEQAHHPAAPVTPGAMSPLVIAQV